MHTRSHRPEAEDQKSGGPPAGRDPESVRLTHAPNLQLFDSEREFARWRQDAQRGMSSGEVYAYIRNRGAQYGTVSAVQETIKQFTDAGRRGFMVSCNGAPVASALEQLASLERRCRRISDAGLPR